MILIQNQPAFHPKKVTWIEIEPPALPHKKTNKQIVQTSPGDRVDQAVPDAFLGGKNQKVDRETIGRNRTTIMGQDQTHAKNQTAKELTKPTQRSRLSEKIQTLSQLGLPILPKAKKPGDISDRAQDTPHWAPQGASPQDYIRGVKESDRTALNTKEYVFFGYFQRIRERLDRAWVPILRERILKLYRSGRQLASDMDHSTRVLVVLNGGGEIIRVLVMNESGTQELDDAAVKAFNQAGPFPNPPKGIVNPNGEVEIPWEFILRT